MRGVGFPGSPGIELLRGVVARGDPVHGGEMHLVQGRRITDAEAPDLQGREGRAGGGARHAYDALWGQWSQMACQGARDAVWMCFCCEGVQAVSRLPSGKDSHPENRSSRCQVSGEPHTEQNTRVTKADDAYSRVSDAPSVKAWFSRRTLP